MASMLWPILRRALSAPMREVVVDDQRTWRYIDLVGGAMHLAERLNGASATKHVAVMLPTGGVFPMTLLACWIAGRVPVPVNYLLGDDERQFILDDCDTDTLITVGPMLEHLGGPEPRGVHVMKLDELNFAGPPPLRVPAFPMGRDLAVIIYTSGTSGRPKGVMLTHRNLRSNVNTAIKHVGLTRSNGFLGVLPQFHSFGLMAMTLVPLQLGAKVIYTARFVPAKLVRLIEKHRPDVFMAIPSMYNALAGVKNAEPDALKSIVMAVSGAEPLPKDVAERFEERFGVHILEGYGLSETSPGVSWSTPWANREGSVGRALPGIEVFAVDDKNRRLPADTEGELVVRGPNVMAGYYKRPDLTAQAIDEDGTFHTGDIGRVDHDGFIFITGRIKEMMIIGGENVFPREIEEVLVAHPSLTAAAVVGKADASRGEVAIAFVEAADEQPFDEATLRAWCRDSGLAGFKVPKEIRLVDELPRSPTGKVLRRQLTEQVRAEPT